MRGARGDFSLYATELLVYLLRYDQGIQTVNVSRFDGKTDPDKTLILVTGVTPQQLRHALYEITDINGNNPDQDVTQAIGNSITRITREILPFEEINYRAHQLRERLRSGQEDEGPSR